MYAMPALAGFFVTRAQRHRVRSQLTRPLRGRRGVGRGYYIVNMILGAEKNVIWLTLACLACLPDTVVEHDLDTEVRGTLTQEIWGLWDESSKYNRCLKYHVSIMRIIASAAINVEVTSIEPLLSIYSDRITSLKECDSTYDIPREEAARRRDLVVTAIETAIGEEVVLYLSMTRSMNQLSEAERQQKLRNWRGLAIDRIAHIADVLPID